MKLYIDDIRTPIGDDWYIVRSSDEAKNFMASEGVPEFISFDHDLGGDDTAMKVVKWMVEMDLDFPGFIPNNFKFNVHSANPVGAANIKGYLNSYLKQRSKS